MWSLSLYYATFSSRSSAISRQATLAAQAILVDKLLERYQDLVGALGGLFGEVIPDLFKKV